MKKRFIVICLLIALLRFIPGCSVLPPSRAFTIGFLPLDTRPCCRDIPLELAAVAGVEILTPPLDELTFFKDEGNTEFVKNWLRENAASCDALVISMEQLLYGGLIQSRNGNLDSAAKDEVISLLKSIKNENPDLPIYLSNVLMRTYTSVFSEEDVIWWEKINAFSNAYYRAEMLHDADAASELLQLKEEIPSLVLDTFLSVRSENHSLNLLCIELVKEGIADKLVICQEDCSEVGIQTVEQKELLEKIKVYGLEETVSIANGTDEAGAELMAYAIDPDGCDAAVCWLGENTEFTASYEDRAFRENLEEHCGFMNISLTENSKNVLCILVPKEQQGDYAIGDFSSHAAYSEQELQDMCSRIKSLTDAGKQCYILDLDCANGGTPEFLSCLGQTMDIKDICGYSGWNTASNSLGTLLAQLVVSRENNSDLNCAYTAERILDEVVYQSVVRPSMYQQANEMYEEGSDEKVNIFYLQNIMAKKQWLAEAFASQNDLIEAIFGADLPIYSIDFRWPRLFEISVKCSGFESGKKSTS